MTLKLICIDMDATLLREDKSYEAARFRHLSFKLMDQGVKMCIASGNSYHKLIEFFDEALIHSLYFASDNGNYLVKSQQVIAHRGLEYHQFIKVMEEIEKYPEAYGSASIGEMTYVVGMKVPGYENVMKYNHQLTVLESYEAIPKNRLVTKIAIYHPGDLVKNKAFANALEEKFDFISVVTSGDQWVDAYTSSGGKGPGIQTLQERYAITPDETLAFGDSLNDLTMMNQVKYSMAMANADEELKAVCAYEVPSNQDQGVIQVLEELLSEGNLEFLEKYRK